MQRVAIMRTNWLKKGSSSFTARVSESPSSLLLPKAKSSTPCLANNFFIVFRASSLGGGCLRRTPNIGKCSRILVATAWFANNMNSSIILFVSRNVYSATSVGSCVSESNSNFTSCEASSSAPLRIRSARMSFARRFSCRREAVSLDLSELSSILAWASAYDRAAWDLMIALQHLTSTISASDVISQTTENVSLSTPPRSEQMSVVNKLGSMSVRRSTRYTVVHRSAASLSIAVPGWTKCVTSAMCTPTRWFPLGKRSHDTASSMSLQPGGSTEQIVQVRKSSRPARSSGPGVQSAGGRHRKIDSPNSRVMTPCSCRMTALSTERSPTSPRTLIQWPRG
mmetsp:Transcript_43394/g.131153  ORF Transcript_43394/g.131153 Transcript_43394/m.131153 type:complete len:339 (+) Transcript_43394:763-1779(+)